MRAYILTIALGATLMLGCTSPPSEFVNPALQTRDCPYVYAASLIEVALNPERYAGHCIGVSGYYRNGRLYLSQEDAQHLAGTLTLSVMEEPGLREPPCDEGSLFLAGPFEMLKGTSGILIPQFARGPIFEGPECITAVPAP